MRERMAYAGSRKYRIDWLIIPSLGERDRRGHREPTTPEKKPKQAGTAYCTIAINSLHTNWHASIQGRVRKAHFSSLLRSFGVGRDEVDGTGNSAAAEGEEMSSVEEVRQAELSTKKTVSLLIRERRAEEEEALRLVASLDCASGGDRGGLASESCGVRRETSSSSSSFVREEPVHAADETGGDD